MFGYIIVTGIPYKEMLLLIQVKELLFQINYNLINYAGFLIHYTGTAKWFMCIAWTVL
jgi:hypothetical protein